MRFFEASPRCFVLFSSAPEYAVSGSVMGCLSGALATVATGCFCIRKCGRGPVRRASGVPRAVWGVRRGQALEEATDGVVVRAVPAGEHVGHSLPRLPAPASAEAAPRSLLRRRQVPPSHIPNTNYQLKLDIEFMKSNQKSKL